jgi:hypothetical protein
MLGLNQLVGFDELTNSGVVNKKTKHVGAKTIRISKRKKVIAR